MTGICAFRDRRYFCHEAPNPSGGELADKIDDGCHCCFPIFSFRTPGGFAGFKTVVTVISLGIKFFFKKVISLLLEKKTLK
nr:hypothetical protein [Nitrosococcus wardiae]